jgi:cell wall-associated NlpC family hydrolase
MRLVAVLGLALVLCGCAAAPRRAETPRAELPRAEALGARAAALADRLVGTPYRLGGTTPDGFDCSGLVVYVYGELGVALPRTAAEQRSFATRVPVASLAPGDLVFFSSPEDHVGIYLGGGEFVHAPGTGRRVERARLDAPYFILGYAGGGRVAGQ